MANYPLSKIEVGSNSYILPGDLTWKRGYIDGAKEYGFDVYLNGAGAHIFVVIPTNILSNTNKIFSYGSGSTSVGVAFNLNVKLGAVSMQAAYVNGAATQYTITPYSR